MLMERSVKCHVMSCHVLSEKEALDISDQPGSQEQEAWQPVQQTHLGVNPHVTSK